MSKNLIENIQKMFIHHSLWAVFACLYVSLRPYFGPGLFVSLTWVSNIRIAPVPAPHKQTNKGPSGAPDYHPLGEQDLSQPAKPFPISIFYETGQ